MVEKILLAKKKIITKNFEKKTTFFKIITEGGTVEELFAHIFGIYKKFDGNNPSILATTNSVSVAA